MEEISVRDIPSYSMCRIHHHSSMGYFVGSKIPKMGTETARFRRGYDAETIPKTWKETARFPRASGIEKPLALRPHSDLQFLYRFRKISLQPFLKTWRWYLQGHSLNFVNFTTFWMGFESASEHRASCLKKLVCWPWHHHCQFRPWNFCIVQKNLTSALPDDLDTRSEGAKCK